MARPTVYGVLELPAGVTPSDVQVRLRLVAGATPSHGFADGAAVGGVNRRVRPNSSGRFEIPNLRPNTGDSSDVITTPSGTVYRLDMIYPDGTTITEHIEVPDTAGDHDFAELITIDPTDLAEVSRWTDFDAGKDDRIHGRPRTSPLRGLNVALADAGNRSVRVVVIGDSMSQDWRAFQTPTILAPNPTDTLFPSWVRIAEEALAERFAGGNLGVGWVPIEATIGSDVYGFDAHTGAAVTDGLGGWGVELSNADTATHTCEFDAVEVFFRAGAGDIEVRVDGSLVDTIDTSTDASPWVSADLGDVTERELELTSVGTTRPYAAYFHAGTRSSGVAFHNGGHAGWGADDHLAITGTLQHIDDTQPDAVIVAIGANDFGDGLSAYTTRIETLIDEVREVAPNAAIVHVACYAVNDRSTQGWGSFVEASRQIAREKSCGFVDLFEVIGDVGVSFDEYDLTVGDALHLTEVGHRLISDTILEATVGAANRLTAAGQGGASDHGDLTGLSGDDHTQYALADGTRGSFLRLALASGETVVVFPTGGKLAFGEVFGAPVLGLRASADANNRLGLSYSGMQTGAGSGVPDTKFERLSAGVWSLDGGKIQTSATPSTGNDLTTKTYVDAASTNDRARANHTGTQLASTISDLATAVNGYIATVLGANVALGGTLTVTGAVSGPSLTVDDGTGGSTRIDHSASAPRIAMRAAAGDTHPVISFGLLLGQGILGFGPGGSTAPDSFLSRAAAGVLTTAGGRLQVGDATAATDAVNRQAGDARWIRSGQAAIVNADISASAGIALSKLATDPLARANHTGTQAGSTVDAATTDARGTVELATTAETQAGTDTARAVTPAALAGTLGWVLIDSEVLVGTSGSISFTGIPGTYGALKLVGMIRTDRASVSTEVVDVAFNGDTTASNYDRQVFGATTSTVAAAFNASNRGVLVATAATATTDHFSAFEMTIPAYAGATRKMCAAQVALIDSGSTGFAALRSAVWKNTAAITSVTLTPTTGSVNFIAGCSVQLYGLRSA